MKEKLTSVDKAAYVLADGVKCPYCDSTDLDGGSFESDAGIVTQDVICLTCNHRWADVYRLDSIFVDGED